jgi:hypothetical protein
VVACHWNRSGSGNSWLGELRARGLDSQVRSEVAKCEAEAKAKEEKSKLAPDAVRGETVCDPAAFSPDTPQPFVRGQDPIADLEEDAQAAHASWKFPALAILAIFCLALLWYFLLDRVSELRAAVSGRDRAV